MTAKKPQCVAYLRVSTQRQGRSGLGVEAQRESVRQHVAKIGGELVGEFVEVESGRRSDRPELEKAMASVRAKGAAGALVVARLDRLSRDARFLLGVVDGVGSRASVQFCDLPDVPPGPTGRFVVTMLAAAAEMEAGLTSERTKAALAAAKARGVKLGVTGRALADRHKADAAERLRPLAPRLQALRAEGLSIRRIAEQLNYDGIASPGGAGRWRIKNVHAALKRLEAMEVCAT